MVLRGRRGGVQPVKRDRAKTFLLESLSQEDGLGWPTLLARWTKQPDSMRRTLLRASADLENEGLIRRVRIGEVLYRPKFLRLELVKPTRA